MGKYSRNPQYHVFTFRADDDTAALIREAASKHRDMSEFLREAARAKAADETRERRCAE